MIELCSSSKTGDLMRLQFIYDSQVDSQLGEFHGLIHGGSKCLDVSGGNQVGTIWSSKEGIPVVGWRIGSGGLYQYKTISNYMVTYDIVCLMTAREVDHVISDT